MIATRRGLGLGLVLVVAFSAMSADAQTGKGAKPPAAKAPKAGASEAAKAAIAKKEATQLADKAHVKFKQGKYAEAIEGFRQADQKFHSPSYLLMVGRSQAKAGQLLDAKATLEGVANEQLASYAPPDFFDAQSNAKKELADVSARIPTLQITPAAGVSGVTLDGRALSDAELSKPIALDPGEHTVTGRAATGDVKATVRLAEKANENLALTPPPAAAPTATASAVETAQATTVAPTATAAPSSTGGRAPPFPALVAFGVGGAGLVAGAVLGSLTLVKKGEFDSAIRDHATPDKILSLSNDGVLLRTLTDVSFGVAVVGAGIGGALWIRSIVSQPKPAGAGSIVVTPYPGGVVVHGAF